MRRKSDRALRAMVAAATLAVTTLESSTARAQDTTVHELKYDFAVDMAVIAGSAGLVLASEYFSAVKPSSCRWCDRRDGVDSLNSVDRWARRSLLWSDPRKAGFASGVTAFLLEPAAATLEMIAASANENAQRAFPVDFLIIAESVAVSTVLNQATKIIVARERPFVHHMNDEERTKTALPSDNNVSFYSGHTSLSFTLAAAAGTVATLRGYRLMPLVWATLMPLAAATGYLRIAADKHYFTDVMTGMVIGTAVGVVLPLLFHGRDGDELVPNGTGTGTGPGTAQLPVRATPQMITISGGF